jgi:hypothetical protein
MYVVFGWLSDKIGRKPIIMAGCLLAAITYYPLFIALDNVVTSTPIETPYINGTVRKFEKSEIMPTEEGEGCEITDKVMQISRRKCPIPQIEHLGGY